MGTSETSIEVAAAPAQVWAVVSDFGGLDTWMPGVDSCRLDGDDRVLTMLGMEVTEHLSRSDDGARVLVYGITKAPFELEHHEATLTVGDGADGGSTVTWAVEVRPDEMTDMFSNVYQQSLEALKNHVEGTGASS